MNPAARARAAFARPALPNPLSLLLSLARHAEQELTGTTLTSVPAPSVAQAGAGPEQPPGSGDRENPGVPAPEAGPTTAPGAASAPVLRLRDLTVRYPARGGEVTAVAGLDLEVRAGETVAIVGESGSGKTTTAAVAAGLLTAGARVEAAEHSVFGTDMRGAGERAWHGVRGTRIGYVPQDTGAGLSPVRTIGSQLKEVLTLHGHTRAEAQDRLREVLAQVGLDPEAHPARFPHEFSGGQRQRILIALALAGDPGLIIADEPTSALDVTVQKQVLDLLAGLVAERGAALVLITHDLGIARDRADRVLVMSGGRLVESGPAAQILERPQEEYTKRLLAAAPGLTGVPLLQSRRAQVGQEPAGEPLIRVTGVVKTYPGHRGSTPRPAVDGASVTLRAGRTVGIVGESGSGKSTTARILVGLESADAGTGTVLGEDFATLPARVRALSRRARFVHQDATAALDPSFTVGQSLAEPLRGFRLGSRAERRARVAELLDLVALPAEFADRRPRELSGGQRQRVTLARALASTPEILVLDEPVSALDVSVQQQILELLLDLQERLGLAYVFISHDLAVVRHIADDVLVMSGGRVVESGPAAEVFDAPRTELTRTLVAAVPGTGTRTPASGTEALSTPAHAHSTPVPIGAR
jgi:peptide/nickel transport system ATP-binding protein